MKEIKMNNNDRILLGNVLKNIGDLFLKLSLLFITVILTVNYYKDKSLIISFFMVSIFAVFACVGIIFKSMGETIEVTVVKKNLNKSDD